MKETGHLHLAESDSATRFVRVGPTRVRVRTVGEGRPLLLLMGIGGNLDMWDPLAAHLTGRKLISFDFPGTGASGTSWLAPTMMHNALFVRLLISRLGYRRLDVLGYSWGGVVAQQLAIQHPTYVRRLVLACTSFGAGSVPAGPVVTAHLLTPRRYYSPTYLTQIAAGTYGGRFRRDPALIEDEVERRINHPPSLIGYGMQLIAVSTYSSLLGLPLIRSRTLVLAGDDDPLVRTVNQKVLGRMIRRSTVRIVPGAGHLLLIESPAASATMIEEFLAAD